MPSAERPDTGWRATAVHAVRSAGWLALALLSATTASFYFLASTSWVIAAGAVGLALLAFWNATDAVLLLAAFAPIASTIQQMT